MKQHSEGTSDKFVGEPFALVCFSTKKTFVFSGRSSVIGLKGRLLVVVPHICDITQQKTLKLMRKNVCALIGRVFSASVFAL